jgi:hypothetical protein
LVTLSVLVPSDRVPEFQTAFAAFAVGRMMGDPPSGAAVSAWRSISASVDDDRVSAFYEAFGNWLTKAVEPAPVVPDMTAEQLRAACSDLPTLELNLLHLFADDDGRFVGWDELKSKFCLAGTPSIERALPRLVEACEKLGCAPPVHEFGSGDDTVFGLPLALVPVVAGLTSVPDVADPP